VGCQRSVDDAGSVADSGEWRGLDQIAKVAQIAFEVSGGTLKARPIELVAAGPESVLGYFHFEANRPDASLDQDGLQRFVVRSGMIMSLHNMFADVARHRGLLQIDANPSPGPAP
jgi:hypothetical protein